MSPLQEGLLYRFGGPVPSLSLTLCSTLTYLNCLSFETGSCYPTLQIRIILPQHLGTPECRCHTLYLDLSMSLLHERSRPWDSILEGTQGIKPQDVLPWG